MKINEQKFIGITGKEVSFSLSELIVLAEVANILKGIDLKHDFIRSKSSDIPGKEKILPAAKDVGVLLSKITYGIEPLDSAAKDMFKIKQEPETTFV